MPKRKQDDIIVKTNERSLPILNTAFLEEIFARVYTHDIDNISDQQARDFLDLLFQMQKYNLYYRQDILEEIAPIMEETIGPFIANSDGPLYYLALGLAIKELYGMSDKTFRTVLNLVSKDKLR